MCIHILYKFHGQKKITNERAFANNYRPSNKIENMYRGPSQVKHYENTDTHDDLTPDTELYSRAVGNKTKQFYKLPSQFFFFFAKTGSIPRNPVSSYSITAK
jgi:hypothetical protein